MIREINELILLLDKNETGFTLYRVFGKSGTVEKKTRQIKILKMKIYI